MPEEPKWWRRGYAGRTNTLESLVDLGLAEARTVYYALEREYRITDAGTALCNSMGD